MVSKAINFGCTLAVRYLMYTARPQAPQARQKYLFLTYNGLLRVSNTSDALNFACSKAINYVCTLAVRRPLVTARPQTPQAQNNIWFRPNMVCCECHS